MDVAPLGARRSSLSADLANHHVDRAIAVPDGAAPDDLEDSLDPLHDAIRAAGQCREQLVLADGQSDAVAIDEHLEALRANLEVGEVDLLLRWLSSFVRTRPAELYVAAGSPGCEAAVSTWRRSCYERLPLTLERAGEARAVSMAAAISLGAARGGWTSIIRGAS